MKVCERAYTVRNRLGIHLRAANKVVRVASRFDSDVFLAKDGLEVDAKSIMGITLLAAACGSQVIVKARGKDAEEAVQAVGALIESKFQEED
ncbi:MAG: HPr family phosphocarrier protein [Thermodesulfobacteriota bacterium]